MEHFVSMLCETHLKFLGEDSFVHGVFIKQLPLLISFKLS